MSRRDGERTAGPIEPGPMETGLDEELSALLDGELEPARAAALRAQVAADPRLARRLEAFRSLDAGLSALSADVSDDELERLRARIAAAAARSPAPDDSPAVPGTRLVRRPRSRLWLALPAAALAAGLALYAAVLAPRGPDSGAPDGGAQDFAELASVSEEEIGIALELDTLADLEEIEQLELLELLASLGSAERS